MMAIITGFRERLFGYGFASVLLATAVGAYLMGLFTLRDWEPYVLFGSLLATLYMVIHEVRKVKPSMVMQENGLLFINLGDGGYNNVNNLSMLEQEKRVFFDGDSDRTVAKDQIQKIVVAGIPEFADAGYTNVGVQETIHNINTRSPAPLSTYTSTYVFYIFETSGRQLAFDVRCFRKKKLQKFCQQLIARGYPLELRL